LVLPRKGEAERAGKTFSGILRRRDIAHPKDAKWLVGGFFQSFSSPLRLPLAVLQITQMSTTTAITYGDKLKER
jgi:hypothetical protein